MCACVQHILALADQARHLDSLGGLKVSSWTSIKSAWAENELTLFYHSLKISQRRSNLRISKRKRALDFPFFKGLIA